MHEQLSGGFRCFVSCRQRRKGKKVGKYKKAPLLISAIIDYAFLTWSLLNPAEMIQYTGNAACMAGSVLPATPLVLWPQCNLLLPLLWQQGQPVDFRGASLWKCEYSCLQKSNIQNGNPRRGKDWEISWVQCPEQSHGQVSKGSAPRLTNCVVV